MRCTQLPPFQCRHIFPSFFQVWDLQSFWLARQGWLNSRSGTWEFSISGTAAVWECTLSSVYILKQLVRRKVRKLYYSKSCLKSFLLTSSPKQNWWHLKFITLVGGGEFHHSKCSYSTLYGSSLLSAVRGHMNIIDTELYWWNMHKSLPFRTSEIIIFFLYIEPSASLDVWREIQHNENGQTVTVYWKVSSLGLHLLRYGQFG